jgi:hypothetical protein
MADFAAFTNATKRLHAATDRQMLNRRPTRRPAREVARVRLATRPPVVLVPATGANVERAPGLDAPDTLGHR